MKLSVINEKVGLYFPFEINLDRMSVNICDYAQAIEAIGRVPVLIIPKKAMTSAVFERIDCESNTAKFVHEKSINLIIALTWYLNDAFIGEYRKCGGKVITLGDDDGMVDSKRFAGSLLGKFINKQDGLLNKIRAVKHWLQVYFLGLLGNAKWIAGIKNTNIFTLPNPECCKKLRESIKSFGEVTNINVKVLYFPVHDHFFDTALVKRRNRIITVSRFSKCDEGQKNSCLLELVIKKFLVSNPDYEWVLVGRNSVARFSKLSQNVKNVNCFDHLDKKDVAKLMSESKILVLTSRWEGSPVSGNEMLSCGGTIVGPPIPGISGLIKDKSFGTESSNYSINSILKALNEEVLNWELGKRNPIEIRNYWKKRVSIKSVGERILKLKNAM
jgi:glycosyltransferase involved in cell wall biosynthesis